MGRGRGRERTRWVASVCASECVGVSQFPIRKPCTRLIERETNRLAVYEAIRRHYESMPNAVNTPNEPRKNEPVRTFFIYLSIPCSAANPESI